MQARSPLSRPVTGRGRASLSQRVGEDVWRDIVRGAPVSTASSGERLETDGAHSVIAVQDGLCRVFLRTPGGRQVTIRYPRGGEVIGLISLLSGWHSWDAEAVTTVTYATVSRERLLQLMEARPDLTRAMAEEVSAMAADSINMLVNASSESMSARVAGHLMELAAASDTAGRPTAYVTHQRLAESTGTAREVVTRVLRRFRVAGAVSTGPGTIVILDEQRLFETVRADEVTSSN